MSRCWPAWLLLEALGRIHHGPFGAVGRLQFLEVGFLLSHWGLPHFLETFLVLAIGLDPSDPALRNPFFTGTFPARPPVLFSLTRENSPFLRVI